MERDRSSEVNRLITQLETTARSELETPDGVTTDMSYRVVIPETFYMSLKNRVDSEVAGYKDAERHTVIFIEQDGEVHDETHCSMQIAFSCIYDHNDKSMHGVQFLSPIDMTQKLPDSTHLEQETYRRILAVAQNIYDKNIRSEDPEMEGLFRVADDELDEVLRGYMVSVLQSTNQFVNLWFLRTPYLYSLLI